MGVKRINGGMKWPFVIRGHKPSMGHPSPFRERGLGVRVKLPVSRTLKSPRCCDCARGTIRPAMQYPHPSTLPEGEGGLPDLFRHNRGRLASLPAAAPQSLGGIGLEVAEADRCSALTFSIAPTRKVGEKTLQCLLDVGKLNTTD